MYGIVSHDAAVFLKPANRGFLLLGKPGKLQLVNGDWPTTTQSSVATSPATGH